MKSYNVDSLPLGYSSFEELRQDKKIYVDKTDLIAQFVNSKSPCFLSRPRRFGKSLLTTTLKSLFEHGLEYFDGLKIKELWHDTTYPVLYLDFLHFTKNNFDEFKDDIYDDLEDFALRNNILIDERVKFKPLKLFKRICSKIEYPFVLLVDEYDSQLSNNIENEEEFNKYRDFLYDFFSTTKSYMDKFRFIFITGVSRFSNISIFSGFNDTTDLSFIPDFSSLVGFTQEELELYFCKYLQRASNILGRPVNVLKQELKGYYDGYSFDKFARTHVYNPWSILKFLADPGSDLTSYWTSSGFSTLVVNYFKNKFIDPNKDNVFNPLLDNYSIDYDELTSSKDIKHLSIISMLYQSGYLTIDSVSGNIYTLRFPNFEMKRFMASFFINNVLCYNNLINKPNFPVGFYKQVIDSLINEDAEKIMANFGKILNYISYNSKIFDDEISVRDIVSLGLSCIGIDNGFEVQSAKGRCDLVIKFTNVTYAFEFKVARNGDNEEKLLNEAMDQIIDRKYMVDFTTEKLVRVAIVESAEKHEFTKCKVSCK